MKYLIAIDSDGTLRRTDGTISQETKEVIKKLKDQGHIIVISTARPRYHTLKISNEVGINDYLISSNGTEVYDNLKKEIIYSSYLDKEEVKRIYNEINNLSLRGVFVTEDIEYTTQFTRNDNQVLLTDNNYNEMLNSNIKQIMIIDTNERETFEHMMKENKLRLPVISSACPAVVRLIRVRFPDLLENLLPINSPVELAAKFAREKAVKETGLRPQEIGVFFISDASAASPRLVS